jgi:hypothetical protein
LVFVADEREAGSDGVGAGDWKIVSDEHCGVGGEVLAAASGGGVDEAWTSVCIDGAEGPSGHLTLECCCSHIARLLGSTGQLEALSWLFEGRGGEACVAVEEVAEVWGEGGSGGGSAFHHPMTWPLMFFFTLSKCKIDYR